MYSGHAAQLGSAAHGGRGRAVAKIDGVVIRESNDIIQALEDEFPEHPMLPTEESDADAFRRVRPLLALERQLFSAWFRSKMLLTSDGYPNLPEP